MQQLQTGIALKMAIGDQQLDYSKHIVREREKKM